MKQKKKCLFVSSLALSLMFMPQVTSLAIAEEIYNKIDKRKYCQRTTKKRGKETGYKEVYWKKASNKKNCYQAGYQQEIGW